MFDAYITTDTIRLLLPEILLVMVAVWTYVGGAFSTGRTLWNFNALVGLILVGYASWMQDRVPGLTEIGQAGPLIIDQFGHAMRWLVLLVGGLFVLTATRAGDDAWSTEYLGSLLLMLAGLMIVCRAGELVLLFAALELISVPTYILLFLGRRGTRNQEATAKYFYLSILSSALLLYGFSFLYGISGSMQLTEIRANLAAVDGDAGGLASLAPLALLLITAGLGFKIAAVPFHYYAPDVYQGTTALNAGLLAVVPKIAGVVALVRLVAVAMPGVEHVGWQMMLALAVLTMTLGNAMALWQQNVRRLLAYSSIAHAGYLLIGLAVGLAFADGALGSGKFDGYSAMLFYLVVYAIATAGAFAALAYLAGKNAEVENVDELTGLGRTNPLIAVAIAVFMFSLAGIPPLAGFWGKLSLFFSALDVDAGGDMRPWFVALAVIAALNAAVAAAYYLRIVAVMYFREPVNVARAEGGFGAAAATVAAAVLVLIAGLFPGALATMAQRASQAAQSDHRRYSIEQAELAREDPSIAKVAVGQGE
jgi:NADH-quinone oxidoreductase subunit N